VIVATFVTGLVVDAAVWTTSTTIIDSSSSMFPRSHEKTVVDEVTSSHSPSLVAPETAVVSGGTGFSSLTSTASSGPLLLTVIVYVITPPAVTGSGASAMPMKASPW
jgi:hypothetical protein